MTTPCEGTCGHPCETPADRRVFFMGCDPACGGHNVCATHGNGRTHLVVRVDKLDDAPPPPGSTARLGP